MTTGEQAELIVNLRLRDQFTAPVKKLQANLQTLDRQTAQLQRGLGKIGQGLKTGLANTAKIAGVGIGFLGLQIKAGIDQLIRFDSIAAQTEAVLKSTKNAAGLTADEIVDMTASLEKLTGIEKETTQEAANLLLTFTNIKEDVFPDTLAIIQDISTAMGSDMNQEAIRLGKALNDPIRGMSALSEVGVTFNDTQRQTIERAQKAGNTLKAQRIILRELKKEFGGSAEAADKTFGGSLRRLRNNVADLQVNLAAPLVQPLARLTRRLTEFAASEEVQQGIRDLGEGIAGLFSDENLESGVAAIKSGFGFIRDLPWDTIKSGLQTTADIAGRAVSLFRSLPPELQTGLVTLLAANKLTGGLVASGIGDIAGFLLRGLTTINATVVNVVGAKVNTPGGGLDVPGAPGAGPSATSIGLRGLPIIGFLLGEMDRVDAKVEELKVLTNRANFTGATWNGARGRFENPTRPGSFGTPLSLGITEAEDLKKAAERLGLLLDESRTSGKGIQNRLRTVKLALDTGAITAKEANKKLTAIDAQIERQKVNVSLQANVNISAVATGNAVTFGSGTNRIIVPT